MVDISPVTVDDIPFIINISDKQLGKNYLTKEYLKKYIPDPSYCNIKATVKNNIVGFSIAQICSFKELKSTLHKEKRWLSRQFENHEPVFFRKVTCTDSTFERMGIAHELVKYSLTLILPKVKSVISVCWKKEGVAPFGNILKDFDFKILKEIPHYWRKDSLNKRYQCSICGNPPCKCTAIIYAKFLL